MFVRGFAIPKMMTCFALSSSRIKNYYDFSLRFCVNFLENCKRQIIVYMDNARIT